ncbi:MAG: hypothetical protein U1F43_19515 [Myxococcota bacterium]
MPTTTAPSADTPSALPKSRPPAKSPSDTTPSGSLQRKASTGPSRRESWPTTTLPSALASDA